MQEKHLYGVKGWLLVYIVSSIPVLLFYSAGLSGWFYDYPLPLFFMIFIVFAVPLILILMKFPKAPRWNMFLLWIGSILIILRILYGILFQSGQGELLDAMPILLAIVVLSLAWSITWTKYFKNSLRVKNTFSNQ